MNKLVKRIIKEEVAAVLKEQESEIDQMEREGYYLTDFNGGYVGFYENIGVGALTIPEAIAKAKEIMPLGQRLKEIMNNAGIKLRGEGQVNIMTNNDGGLIITVSVRPTMPLDDVADALGMDEPIENMWQT